MPSLIFLKRRFAPGWWMTVFALAVILLFTRLGFWQLARAAEKEEMLAAQALRANQAAVLWSTGSPAPEQYQKIRVQGKFLPWVFFLDNQHYQHQPGYRVLSALQLEQGELLLVDRGWVKAGTTRQDLPQISTPEGSLELSGSVYYPSLTRWSLGELIEKKEGNVLVIEQIDLKTLSQFLQKTSYPFIMRLDKQEAHGFLREWPVVSMPPQRHFAYALQWFAMAFVILIIFIALNIKKI